MLTGGCKINAKAHGEGADVAGRLWLWGRREVAEGSCGSPYLAAYARWFDVGWDEKANQDRRW